MIKEPPSIICAVILVLLHLAIVFPLINIPDIGGSSEAREAHVIKAIVSTNDWVLPARNGLIPSKPPLFHWAGAGLTYLGLDPLYAARATSTLFGSGTLVLTFLMAGLLVRPSADRSAKNKINAGFISLVVLTTLLLFEHMFGEARVDMAFAMFSSLALFSLLSLGLDTNNYRRAFDKASWHYLIFFTACGFAVLSRGPGAIPYILVLSLAVLAWLSGWRSAFRALLRPRWSWLIFLGLSMPWYILAFVQGGSAFFDKQISFETFQRLIGGEHIKSEPLWFYLRSSAPRTLPWLPFLILFGLSDYTSLRKLKNVFSSQEIYFRRIRFAPVIWFISGLVLLSILSGKRHSYLLPLLPAFAAYLGASIESWTAGLAVKEQAIFRSWAMKVHLLPAVLACIFVFAIEFIRIPFLSQGILPVQLREWFFQGALFWQSILCVTLIIALLAARVPSFKAQMVLDWLLVVLVFNIAIYCATAMRSQLKEFSVIAKNISAQVGSKKLSVIRTEHQEFFDPILYYLPYEIDRIEPTNFENSAGDVSCLGLYLATRSWFDHFRLLTAQSNLTINYVREFSSALNLERPETNEGMVIFGCQNN
jgi:4-amino-4-deoxy-L-arabinose transferase-like glycosyltransferase